MATPVVFEPGWQRHINGDIHHFLERMETEIVTQFLGPSLFGVRSL
jgi:hypothetical protein